MKEDIAEKFSTGSWQFTAEVAEVFDDHVRASVPHYDLIQDLVAETTDWLLPAGSLVADLGAATGTTVERIFHRHPDRELRAILYDDQDGMLDKARQRLAAYGDRVSYSATRVQNGPYEHQLADLTMALFTLQFLPYRERVAALRLARTSSRETGAILVAEKVRCS